MKRFLGAFALLCLWTVSAQAQGGSLFSGGITVLGPTGRPLAGATVTICAFGVTGIPCSPTITVYTSPALTTPAANPQTSDGLGNVFVYAAPGRYTFTVTGPGITGTSLTATVAGSGGGDVLSSASNTFALGFTQTFNGPVVTTNTGTHSGTETLTGLSVIGNYNSIRTLDGTKYAFTGAGLTTAISDCIADSLCPGVDARSLTAAATVSSILTLSKPMFLWLGPATVTLQGTPGLLVSSNINGVAIRGIGQSGQASTSTTLNCTGAATDCVRWLGRRGSMSDLTILITGQNATNGLTLDAITAGQDVDFNTFTNISLVTSSTSTADGIRLRASDATHKVSFNQFINPEVIDFSNGGHMTGGVSVGPTNNFVAFGQFRQTSVRGNGWLLDNFSADNKWYGGNYSFYTTALALTGGSGVTGNGFFGSVLESNTNACSIASGASDNQFYNVPFGSQPCTDNGTRTVVLSGNNQLGPGSSGLVKLGGPISFLSIGGGNSGIPAATGTNFSIAGNLGTPILGRLYVGDGTGFQLNFAKRTASTDTDLWQWLDSGNAIGAGSLRTKLHVSDQGTACANDNIALSAGWGTTATVTAAAGQGQTCQWTITSSGTGQAANPTITWTVPTALPSASVVCSANVAGGTQAFTSVNQTTLSATVPAFTFNGTPVAGNTVFVVLRCGP